MKGYWHFVALAVLCSIFTVIFETYVFVVVLLLWFFYLYYWKRVGKIPIILSIIFFLIFLIHLPSIESTPMKASQNNLTSLQRGEIISPIKKTSQTVSFTFKNIQNEKLLATIFYPDEHVTGSDQLKHGAVCTINGEKVVPETSRNPGQFDYQAYLKKQGITHQLIINGEEDISCSGSSVLQPLFNVRTFVMEHIENVSQADTASWINALLLGDREKLDDSVVDVFNRWSLSHLLAISGLHIGIIVAFLYVSLVQLNVMTKEKAQWIVFLFLPIYTFLAGSQPSVLRAGIMVMLVVLLNKSNQRYSYSDVISIVFILIILFDKYIVYHVGFQFSFIVTFSILLSRKWIARSESKMFQLFQIGFVSQMVILPLQLTYFSTFHPMSILLNMLVVPYFTFFVIPYMFILLLTSLLPAPLFYLVEMLFLRIHELFLISIEMVDKVAYYPFTIGQPPLVWSFIYLMLFVVFMRQLQLKHMKSAFHFGSVLILCVVWLPLHPYVSAKGVVTMLDIGQGDAFVIELPYRKGVFIVDAGAKISYADKKVTNSVYKQVIKPYLDSRGIRTVDAVFLTHEDIDHIGSFSYMLEDLKVQKLIISNTFNLDANLKDKLLEKNVLVKRINYNEKLVIAKHPFYFLSPQKDKHSTNENSLVFYTTFGGKDWLFTGDIGKETEKEIITLYDQLAVDILKVAHHGSKTSTDPDFIKQIDANIALISVGKNNRYGHPANEVIETLKEEGIVVLRTDKHGAVQYHFDNNQGTFQKYLP